MDKELLEKLRGLDLETEKDRCKAICTLLYFLAIKIDKLGRK